MNIPGRLYPIFSAMIRGIGILLMISAFTALSSLSLGAQAEIREEWMDFNTCGYGDADPVAKPGRMFPYFRFDEYALKGKVRKWKVVRLENPYIRVLITPQIGGKVWGAVEKSTGLPFIYCNDAVKFRDIAMRGPWTSGGVEFNFGVIGHTPAASERVEYITRTAADGAAECVIGGLDLASRTEWRVLIRLPKDAAYFETSCSWYNPTPLHQSGYHWTNAGAAARDDLVFYYPGTHYIGHDGSLHSWPADEQGRRLDAYAANNFGSYKSYHVLGQYTDHFGGYWSKLDFGFGHWSPYGQKPGKKLWIWGLSRQGMIWEDLLTDKSGQYIEFQSGRMFNQAVEESSRTPFKNAFLSPMTWDQWKEVWFPCKGIGGMVKATPQAVLNVIREKGGFQVALCALEPLQDELLINWNSPGDADKAEKTERVPLALKPMEICRFNAPDPGGDARIDVLLKSRRLEWSSRESETHRLFRPLQASPDYNWSNPEGLFMAGEELFRQREYYQARRSYESCIQANPHHLMALTRLAELYYRDSRLNDALEFARRALAVDAGAPAANFIGGLILRDKKEYFQALDAFGWALRSLEFRSPSALHIAEIYFLLRHRENAREYAAMALDYNRFNLDAHQLLALIFRQAGDKDNAWKKRREILDIDPLNFFARYEELLEQAEQMKQSKQVTDWPPRLIVPDIEFPHETFLETALRYLRLGCAEEARLLLQNSPEKPVISYWLAFLSQNNNPESKKILLQAINASPHLVFPFRRETADLLDWAQENSPHWKNIYYRALIHWNNGFPETAAQKMSQLGHTPDYDVFYITRAQLNRFLQKEATPDPRIGADLLLASRLGPANWRAWRRLSRYYLENGNYAEAEAAASKGLRLPGGKMILSLDYAAALVKTGKYDQCLALLAHTVILPCEGSKEAHDIYRAACLLSAVEAIRANQYQKALKRIDAARLWPETLGAGKPYNPPEELENYLERLCRFRSSQTKTGKPSQKTAIHEEYPLPSAEPGAPGADLIKTVLQRLNQR